MVVLDLIHLFNPPSSHHHIQCTDLGNKYLIKYLVIREAIESGQPLLHNTGHPQYVSLWAPRMLPHPYSLHTTVQKLHLVFPNYSSASSKLCARDMPLETARVFASTFPILASTAVTPAGGLLVLALPPAQREF